MEWSNLLIAILVFLSIYLMFFLISVFSDMYIVGVALASAVLAYVVQKPDVYSNFLEFLEYVGIVNVLNTIGLSVPEQQNRWGIFIMLALIVLTAVVICLPFLPFSDTYRKILGVEKPMATEEAKIRHWVIDEIERVREEERVEEDCTREEETMVSLPKVIK